MANQTIPVNNSKFTLFDIRLSKFYNCDENTWILEYKIFGKYPIVALMFCEDASGNLEVVKNIITPVGCFEDPTVWTDEFSLPMDNFDVGASNSVSLILDNESGKIVCYRQNDENPILKLVNDNGEERIFVYSNDHATEVLSNDDIFWTDGEGE